MANKPGNPNHNKNAVNLAKLRGALDAGHYVDAKGEKQPIPQKSNGTVKRADLAAGLGFVKSAFQKVWKDGEKVDTEFAVMVNEYDLNNTGKSGADFGGRPRTGGDDEQVKQLNQRISTLEHRIGTLQLERDEANAKLVSVGYVDAELDGGSIRLPW